MDEQLGLPSSDGHSGVKHATAAGPGFDLRLSDNLGGTGDDGWGLIAATYEEARAFLEGARGQQVGEADDEAGQACLVFVARALAAGDAQAAARKAWPLSKIVAHCNTNLYDFYRELPVKAAKLSQFLAEAGTTWGEMESRSHVKEWQKMLLSLTMLSKKFKDLVSRLIQNMGIHKQAVLRLGWLLFLTLRAKLLPTFPDLVSCMTLLACVVNVLVVHAPKLPDSMTASAAPGGRVDTLHALCCELKMDPAAAAAMMASVGSLLTHMLPCFVGEWRAEDGAHPSPAVSASCRHFRGLLVDPARRTATVHGLEREYAVLYAKGREFDEREFLQKDFSSLASPRMSPTSFYNAAKRVHLSAGGAPIEGGVGSVPFGRMQGPHKPAGAFNGVPFDGGGAGAGGGEHGPRPAMSLPHGLQSPLPMVRLLVAGGPASTPVSETMASAHWLKVVTSAQRTEPGPGLQARLVALGGPHASARVAKVASELAEAGLPDDRCSKPAGSMLGFPSVQPQVNALRRAEALKLYYLVLESVLVSEAASGGAGGLLAAPKFHAGLMACALEVVIAAYRMPSAVFPSALARLHLTPFDLSKVVQPFVKYLASVPGLPLPRELKRHLYAIEERVVEALAWEPGSPLYALLRMAVQMPAALSQLDKDDDVATVLSEPESSDLGSHADAAVFVSVGVPRAPLAMPAGAPSPSAPVAVPGRGCSISGNDDAPCGAQFPAGTSPKAMGSSPMGTSPKRCAASQAALSRLGQSPAKRSRFSDGGDAAVEPPALPLPLAVGPPAAVAAASPVLSEFLRKALKLLSFRLALMIDAFGFSPAEGSSIFAAIMEVLEHAVYHQTHLMYNRHIDQLMLSALYGYCKVHKLAKSFTEITAQYKRQPQAAQQVYRVVTLEQSNPGLVPKGKPGDIIAFYNECFVPAMKPFLLRKRGSDGGAAPASTHVCTPSPGVAAPAPHDAHGHHHIGHGHHLGAIAAAARTGVPAPSSPRCTPQLLGRPPIPRVRRMSAEGMPPYGRPVPIGLLAGGPPGAGMSLLHAAGVQQHTQVHVMHPQQQGQHAHTPAAAKTDAPERSTSAPAVGPRPAAAPAVPRCASDAPCAHPGGATRSLSAVCDAAASAPAAAAGASVLSRGFADALLPLTRMPSGIAALLLAAEVSEEAGRSRAASPSTGAGPAPMEGADGGSCGVDMAPQGGPGQQCDGAMDTASPSIGST
ncbi:hypothetical protein FOA52_012064 [Chlamydomonas sp. UWO 241]|nr:hypothetical protein FOA52_012064 [Chlamydomonas sp. UWO 241]